MVTSLPHIIPSKMALHHDLHNKNIKYIIVQLYMHYTVGL